jgi:hypothetical protein
MNEAETPSVIQTFDDPQLEFDHQSGKWVPTHADEFFMFMDTRFEPWRNALDGLGQGVTVCPPCAFFGDGRCTWCPGEQDPGYPSDRPECAGCLGTQRPQPPWYRRSEIMVPLLTTIAVTTVATISSAILLKRIGLR